MASKQKIFIRDVTIKDLLSPLLKMSMISYSEDTQVLVGNPFIISLDNGFQTLMYSSFQLVRRLSIPAIDNNLLSICIQDAQQDLDMTLTLEITATLKLNPYLSLAIPTLHLMEQSTILLKLRNTQQVHISLKFKIQKSIKSSSNEFLFHNF